MYLNLSSIIKWLLVAFGFILLLDLKRLFGDYVFIETIQSVLKGILYLLPILLLLVFYRKGTIKGLDKSTYILLGYVFICMLSIFWTEDLISTIIGIVSITGTICLGLLCTQFLGIQKSVKYFILGVELIIILSLLNVLLGRDSFVYLQNMDRYVGITFGPHALARGAAVAFIYWFCRISTSWHELTVTIRCYALILLGLSLASILLADSRQVLGALFIAIIFSLWKYTYKYMIFLLAFIPMFIAAFTVVVIVFDLNFINLNMFIRSDISELTTFTGRTDIWLSALELIKDAPLLGYGFNAGGGVLESTYNTTFGWSTRSAHNFFLHAMLDVGLLGAIFLVAWYIQLSKKVIRSGDVFFIASIIFFTIVCFIERIIAGNVGFGMFFLILISTAIFHHNTLVKKEKT